ncbi:N-acyl-D-amino-acid deacylase family protein [Microlunatus parietis]|uniref:N-acyl-D-amino-acid deacylase n=1 Tax=Microlunatus parietis TaxID=682979 RepID=A0A7Y9ICU5_9ACTN|nr:amidohydrolase family protein [Microlunatus parietis]NYE74487.1 N-acyl-D-amino-acid deacylase [Microlunatus parietis]
MILDGVVVGGSVVDGTGAVRRRADLGWRDGRIVAVGDLGGAAAEERIDADGLVVAPGFVDLHGHSDLSILDHPAGTSKIRQGVTTEVAGNCGLAVAPVAADAVAGVRGLLGIVELPEVPWSWSSVGDYLALVERSRPNLRIALLAGHLAIRASVVGLDQRPPDSDELAAMGGLVQQALDEGAVGLSLGLMYPPSAYASVEELTALAEVVARNNAVLTVHLRDYGAGLLDAVREALTVAERSGCRLQISHLTVAGRRNWGSVPAALAEIDAAAEAGVDVAVDCYPYLAGSTNLSQLAPRWAMDGGQDGLHARLAEPELRTKIIGQMSDPAVGWDEILLGLMPGRPELAGRTVADLAAETGQPPAAAAVELLAVADPSIIAFGRSEADLRAVMTHRLSMIGSDGLAVDPERRDRGLPHPRYFGAYPGLFQRYVREESLLSVEDAVRRCTSAPALRAGLADRGRLEPGLLADLVIFDPATITERSTYLDPWAAPEGIARVVVGGRTVAVEGAVEPVGPS